MSIESVDTNSNYLLPGKYTFTVISSPKSGAWGETANYHDWQLRAHNGLKHEQKIPVWLEGPLLNALGCAEERPGVFALDKEMVVGQKFDGEIVAEEYAKKDGTKGKRNKLVNPVAIAGFPRDTSINGVSDDNIPF